MKLAHSKRAFEWKQTSAIVIQDTAHFLKLMKGKQYYKNSICLKPTTLQFCSCCTMLRDLVPPLLCWGALTWQLLSIPLMLYSPPPHPQVHFFKFAIGIFTNLFFEVNMSKVPSGISGAESWVCYPVFLRYCLGKLPVKSMGVLTE